ncbi:MAG: 2-hydroxyhepta-2,4-diene-1,7-dioate isomerase [Crocinitomicaceae bacterium]|nr:2-hydroxyhepta-2,4-diene-1,7-dioate isomerase [Crocinitomicaceae bacterium]|tara:strand:- start:428 stop:1033 length:606 start_codon:yes stop_codon:yes gene_type:complete
MKIICIGRNYKDHAKEMAQSIPDVPMFFLKPDSALLPKRNPFFIPNFSDEVHYEVELIYKIKKVGKSIDSKFSNGYYEEVGLGIDFTARDLQQKCKENGHPWEIAKAFDQSALVGEKFLKINSKENINFSLQKNGELVQKSSSDNMIFNVDEIISYVSKFMTLKIGDLIFTGTPSGVGPVSIGDTLEGFINEMKIFKVNIK